MRIRTNIIKIGFINLWSITACLFYSVVVSGLCPDGQILLSLSTHWISTPSLISTWNASDPYPCSWPGVLCDPNNNNFIVSLDLSGCQITGQLGPEISRLTHLKSINLSSNYISGPIPSQIANCSLLQHLDLSLNFFSGNIPESLGNLLNLKYLSLFNNSLNASIPESVFRIPNLEILLLSFNNLNGFIPSNLGNSTKLQQLCIDNNRFTQSLPDSLNNLANIVYLDAHDAGLEGKIPLGGSCKNLIYLDLSFNQFISLPPELGNCSKLQQFAVVGSGLTGPIPSSFGQLTNMILLYLSDNELSGSIPYELSNCTSLVDLQLDTNQLKGLIPSELGTLKLTKLYLMSNFLTGEVPTSIWKIETLEELLLYENHLFGELPIEVTWMKQLRKLTLYTNRFSGIIPQTLGINSSSLTILDFMNNSFTGPVPPNLCSGNKLLTLVLGLNPLEGSVPFDLSNCPSLKRLILKYNNLTGPLPDFVNTRNLLFLNLQNNGFEGEIPKTYGNLINITKINLSMNRLYGVVPKEVGNLLQLQGLNLSYNVFEGQLPSQLGNCSRMLNFDASHNSFNGSIPTALRTMSGLLTLDLSENHFSGSIPSFVADFKALIDLRLGGNSLSGTIPSGLVALDTLVTLNISINSLTGKLPSGFNKLVMLQDLDVSHNHLNGTLTSLAELHALTDLNISYNLFTGQIPAALVKFLKASAYSFLGNLGLCVDCSLMNDCDATRITLRRCSSHFERRKGLNKLQTAMVALGTSAFLFAAVIGLDSVFHCTRRDKHDIEEMVTDKESDSSLFRRVMEATMELDDTYLIGKGAHGSVYKATLDEGIVYAVKKLEFRGGEKEGSTSMIREIQTVGKVRHRNVVKLEQFWMKKDYGLILYRFMDNGSLHDILHEVYPPPLLDWSIRCNIALGTAHGLAYLHFDCDPAIVHRDIKPMNILLDAELEPHISDFGIAKLLDQSSSTLMSGTLRGTIGYIAPENAFTSTKSTESDVYSYGVVLLELMTRKQAVDPSFEEGLDIVRWMRSVWSETVELELVVDPGLYDDLYDSFVREQVTQVLQLALRCTQTEPSKRPSMRDVVKELEDVYARIGSKLKESK
ncbi:uncharacterized protein [Rutidosis leptorrhynchoides]|uniref:uncharacterized protein n=1 Tax=Rutidosis leptorrhynchoides TaxID=125765 RepID=UPI003A9A0C83